MEKGPGIPYKVESATSVGSSLPDEEKNQAFGDLTFPEIQEKLRSRETTGNYRNILTVVRNRAIDDIRHHKEGEFLEEIKDRIREELPETTWNGKEGIIIKLTEIGEYYDKQLMEHGGRKAWKGLIPEAIKAEVARLRLAGIAQRERGRQDIPWRQSHGYDEAKLQVLGRLTNNARIFDLLPPNAETIVGRKIIPTATRGAGELTEDVIARGVKKGKERFASEREPAPQVSMAEFRKSERLCIEFDDKDAKTLLDRIKNPAEREIFKIETEIFKAARDKRNRSGSMENLIKNEAMTSITTAEYMTLFQRMPGYLVAMQEIADIVVNRRDVGNLSYTLLDCQNDGQFLAAVGQLDHIVARSLRGRVRDIAKARELSSAAVNAAINTMYVFNVFEFYNSYWGSPTRTNPEAGRIRYKSSESRGLVQRGKEGPTRYGRLVAKQIQEAMCPMDAFLAEILGSEEKSPVYTPTQLWARTQLERAGVKKSEDFDVIRVLQSNKKDAAKYWTLERDGRGTKILLVPPLRPKKLMGSVLDVNEVVPVGRRNKKKFIDALVDRDNLDYPNLELPDNISLVYALGAKNLDVLRNAFSGSEVKGGLPDIVNALSSLGLRKCMELIAWMHADLIQGIEIDSRIPTLDSRALYSTRVPRKYMGLPESDKFDLMTYLDKLPEEARLDW